MFNISDPSSFWCRYLPWRLIARPRGVRTTFGFAVAGLIGAGLRRSVRSSGARWARPKDPSGDPTWLREPATLSMPGRALDQGQAPPRSLPPSRRRRTLTDCPPTHLRSGDNEPSPPEKDQEKTHIWSSQPLVGGVGAGLLCSILGRHAGTSCGAGASSSWPRRRIYRGGTGSASCACFFLEGRRRRDQPERRSSPGVLRGAPRCSRGRHHRLPGRAVEVWASVFGVPLESEDRPLKRTIPGTCRGSSVSLARRSWSWRESNPRPRASNQVFSGCSQRRRFLGPGTRVDASPTGSARLKSRSLHLAGCDQQVP